MKSRIMHSAIHWL